MGERRKGAAKIEPGQWSLAVAARMSQIVDSRPGRRDRFAEEAGFSTRINQLLNGQRAWYLEDVEQACAALDLDFLDFLESLEDGTPHPELASVTRLPMSDPMPSLMAVADDQDEATGEDPDSGYDHA
jgi:hypothetical protein